MQRRSFFGAVCEAVAAAIGVGGNAAGFTRGVKILTRPSKNYYPSGTMLHVDGPLEAVGVDTDGKIKPICELSYVHHHTYEVSGTMTLSKSPKILDRLLPKIISQKPG